MATTVLSKITLKRGAHTIFDTSLVSKNVKEIFNA